MTFLSHKLYNDIKVPFKGIEKLIDSVQKSQTREILHCRTSMVSAYEFHSDDELKTIDRTFNFKGHISSIVEQNSICYFTLSDKYGSVLFITDSKTWSELGLQANSQASLNGKLSRFTGFGNTNILGFILIPN